MSRSYLFLLAFFFCSATVLAQTQGNINGFVRKAKTLVPLQGVTIGVVGTDRQALTDSNGFYRIRGLETRIYTLEATSIGYKSQQKFDLQLTSGNTLEVNFELEEESQQMGTIVVRANFPKPVGVVNSVQSLSANEIVRYPGANFDMAKVVQSFPGVSGSVGFRNDIIIRGGAPNENVYYLDGVEVPTINHFSTQGAAGGPVGILNVAFLDRVTLHTSAFPARFDNPLSGVLQFKQRNGNPERFQGNIRLSASETALTGEGPLGKANGKTTYIASVRRSYLQFLFKAIGLPFLPDYWDYQYKITHKPDANNEINIIGIGSIDKSVLLKPKDATIEQLSILDRIPEYQQRTNTIGISWRHAMDKGYWQLVASKNTFSNGADKYENNDKSSENNRILKYNSLEDENRLRFEINFPLGKLQMNAGAQLIYTNYENSTFQRRFGFAANYQTAFSMLRYGAFVSSTVKLAKDRLSITAGLRTDGNDYMTNGNKLGEHLSPRLAATYFITRGLNVNASVARYYKTPAYTILGFQQKNPATGKNEFVNKNADFISSDHFVAGLEWLPSSSIRITAEGFVKNYGSYPISLATGISLANLGGDFGVLGNEAIFSTGKGKTSGFEVLYQQRLTKQFYGILSYTYYASKFSGFDGILIPSAWDNNHLVSFTGGYRLKRNWEIGVRFRYQGGAPYTPYDIAASVDNYYFIGDGVLDYSRLNQLRLRAFNAADIRIDKKFNFKKWSLDLYLDIQNAYNSQNPTPPNFTLKRNADESFATSSGEPYNPGVYGNPFVPNNRSKGIPLLLDNTSGAVLPSLGFVIEF
ncbi:MAG: TonB-dependent receptor [Bacteroidota bacterium]